MKESILLLLVAILILGVALGLAGKVAVEKYHEREMIRLEDTYLERRSAAFNEAINASAADSSLSGAGTGLVWLALIAVSIGLTTAAVIGPGGLNEMLKRSASLLRAAQKGRSTRRQSPGPGPGYVLLDNPRRTELPPQIRTVQNRQLPSNEEAPWN